MEKLFAIMTITYAKSEVDSLLSTDDVRAFEQYAEHMRSKKGVKSVTVNQIERDDAVQGMIQGMTVQAVSFRQSKNQEKKQLHDKAVTLRNTCIAALEKGDVSGIDGRVLMFGCPGVSVGKDDKRHVNVKSVKVFQDILSTAGFGAVQYK